MHIANEKNGHIICEHDKETQFRASEVSGQQMIYTDEADFPICKGGDDMKYGTEENKERLDAFHRNSAISDVLNAAAAAATRKLSSREMDPEEYENAICVLDVVEEQRALVEERLRDAQRDHLGSVKDEKEPTSLDARLQSASARANGQQKNEEPRCHTYLHDRE